MANIDEIQKIYKQALQDLALRVETADTPGGTNVRDENIKSAIRDFSRRIPQVKVADNAAPSSDVASLPADWDDGFSSILLIESPLGRNPPSYIFQKKHWDYYRDTTGPKIFFFLRPGSTWRITYSLQFKSDATDLPGWSLRIIGRWAAAFSCMYLANHYRQTRDPTIGADSVNYRAKEREYTRAYETLVKYVEDDLRVHEIIWQKQYYSQTKYYGWVS